MSLEIKINEKKPGVFVAEVCGEINTSTYQKLEKELDPVVARACALVLDLQGLTYISSMGLGVLFRIKQALEKKNANLMLVNLTPQIKLVFETMKILPEYMFADLEDADEAMDAFLDGVQKGRITPQVPKV